MFGIGSCELMIPFIAFTIWLIIVIYVISLGLRLVRAVEKIAQILENKQ
jgi:hypothetical protein